MIQLLAFRFGNTSNFEGQLVGALERIEVTSGMRALDGLFVSREPASGELSAILLADLPPSRITSGLLDFRLSDRARSDATRRTLDGPAGEAVGALAALLTPGTAVAALLVEHGPGAPPDALADAVARLRGTRIASEIVDSGRIVDAASSLVAATRSAVERIG